LNTSLALCSLLQAVVEEGVGAVEVEVVAAGTNRVVSRTVISLRVLVLVVVEVGGTPLPTMPSQTGLMLRGEANNTAVVNEVEGTTDTHPHGKTRVKAACASSTALRVVATRVTIVPFCTSR
jgi:hypothetical protein